MNMGHDQHSPHKMMPIARWIVARLTCIKVLWSKRPILHSAIDMMRGGNFRTPPVLRKRCHWLRQRACRLGRGCRFQPRINSRAGDVQFVFDNARWASQMGSRNSGPSHRNWLLQGGFPYRFLPPAPRAGQRSLLPCRPVTTKSPSSTENISNGP